MAIQTGIEGRPWYWGLGIGLLVTGVLFFVMHQWKYKEMTAQIQRQGGRIEDLQAQVQKGRIAKMQLPQFREEVLKLETELDKLLRILPARRNTPELLRRIRTLTEQGDFEIRRIKPGSFIDRDFYMEWPIAINLRGTYHNLALFFDKISRFSRIINVENLKIEALRQQSHHTIGTNFIAKTFIYKEAPPTPPPQEPAGRRRGGRRR